MVLPVLLRGRRGSSSLRRLERLHVPDERDDVLLAQQALESRHQRLVAGRYLDLWRENRFANVRLIHRDRCAVVEFLRLPESVHKRRSASASVVAMAGVARQVVEQLLATL